MRKIVAIVAVVALVAWCKLRFRNDDTIVIPDVIPDWVIEEAQRKAS